VPKTGIPQVDLDYNPAPFGYTVKAAAPHPWEVKGGPNPYPGPSLAQLDSSNDPNLAQK
jgi:hypothetical protein